MEAQFAQPGIPFKRPDGRTAVIERKRKRSKRSGGSTARHEARHAVAAEANGTRVVYASIVPGPGYLGITQLAGFDAVAAAAPHAHGDGGIGHDVSIIERAGESVGAAASAAKRILAGRKEEVEAVAAALEESGTLSGSAIRNVMAEANEPEFVMRIISPQGQTLAEKPVRAANENNFLISADLPKAA